MGCSESTSSTEVTTVSSATSREEWNAIRKRFITGKTKYEARQRDKIWDEIDKDHSGTLTYAEVERGAISALGLTNLMPVDHLRPVLVRAYNAAKMARTNLNTADSTMAVKAFSMDGAPSSPTKSKGPSYQSANEASVKIENPKTIHGLKSSESRTDNTEIADDALPAGNGDALDEPSPSVANPLSSSPRKNTAPIIVQAKGMNTFLTDTQSPSKDKDAGDSSLLCKSASISISNSASGLGLNNKKRFGTSASASLSVKQKEQANQLQREEFRLFLLYIADYMELYVVFMDIIGSANSNRNRKSMFTSKAENKNMTASEFVSAMPRLKSWGIDADDDPAEIFGRIDASHNGTITFKEFSDWLVVEHSKLET
eukprot:GILI01008776.1.p1 GENE.GILI01008776.1~~GILI01008776.1.p1  ORF type:complete len:371 (+),score=19.67 GILI01008776.1:34-1146(+)